MPNHLSYILPSGTQVQNQIISSDFEGIALLLMGVESGLFCSLDLFKNIKSVSFIVKHESVLEHLLCWLHFCMQQKL